MEFRYEVDPIIVDIDVVNIGERLYEDLGQLILSSIKYNNLPSPLLSEIKDGVIKYIAKMNMLPSDFDKSLWEKDTNEYIEKLREKKENSNMNVYIVGLMQWEEKDKILGVFSNKDDAGSFAKEILRYVDMWNLLIEDEDDILSEYSGKEAFYLVNKEELPEWLNGQSIDVTIDADDVYVKEFELKEGNNGII